MIKIGVDDDKGSGIVVIGRPFTTDPFWELNTVYNGYHHNRYNIRECRLLGTPHRWKINDQPPHNTPQAINKTNFEDSNDVCDIFITELNDLVVLDSDVLKQVEEQISGETDSEDGRDERCVSPITEDTELVAQEGVSDQRVCDPAPLTFIDIKTR